MLATSVPARSAEGRVVTGSTLAVRLSGRYEAGSVIVNSGSVAVYFGGSNSVAASGETKGFALLPGASIGGIEITDLGIFWAIGAGSWELSIMGLS